MEKEEKPPTKPARGRKKKGAPEEPAVSVEAKAEAKEVLPPRPAEAVPPRVSLKEGKEEAALKKEAEEPKPKEVPLKKAR